MAVFSEQGTSASHLSAAKFLDAIARAPGCAGEDADATSAYTQSLLDGSETWISIPVDKWPSSWHGTYDTKGPNRPVVCLYA